MRLDRVGRYRVLRTLGRGAAGVVLLAWDELIERQVALKVLRVDPDAADAAARRAQFLREVRAAGRLHHPGIVGVHDAGLDPDRGLVFIAMEHVDGTTLRDELAAAGRFPPRRAVTVVVEAARALDYAHFQGVVHRDVKPANLLLDRSGAVKVTDFGVAKVDLFDRTFGGRPVGTLTYMAPEQVRGLPVDGRTDLYALGLVLFELLTGRRARCGQTLLELAEEIVDGEAPELAAAGVDLPPALGPLVARCLARDPDRRFPTCGDLARALDAVGLGGAGAGGEGSPSPRRGG